MARRKRTVEEKLKAQKTKAEKLKGNKNAQLFDQPSKVIRVSGATISLLTDYFASQGNCNPSSRDLADALHYAATKVYGRQIEQNETMIY